MRLSAVEVRDYRSIFVDDSGQPLRLELGTGSNTLVGQNNCGKSNVLRAISLAMDPNHPFIPAADRPGPRQFANPIITLTFEGNPSEHGDEATTTAVGELDNVMQGRRGSSPFTTSVRPFALEVSFVPLGDQVQRKERLLLPGVGRATLTDHAAELQREAIARLRAAVRFVLISTGESIESVLEGNFREILHSVVRDQLQVEFDDAEQARLEYTRGIQESLLGPLRRQLAHDVRGLFPEIADIGLSPEVSTIEQTLSRVGVSLDDIVSTPLAGKGTGVRGGLLVAMLSYLAINATKSMVFAVEEPEAFLHPAAQENLRDQLERVAAVTGVTLLVSTHSPFIVSRSSAGRVFCLAKDKEGRTRLSESAGGDADHAPLIGGLLRESSLEDVIAAASAIPPDAQAVVLLEGEGDLICLRTAAALVYRPDLLEGLDLRPTGGTSKMIAQAVIMQAATDLPLVIVVDNDEPGREVKVKLVGDTFGFTKKQFLNYSMAFDEPQWTSFPVEAEDLYDPALMQGFVDEHGESVISGKVRRPDGEWHYDLDQSAKALLEKWLATETQPAHVERWIRMIQQIRVAAKLGKPTETPAEIVAAAGSRTVTHEVRTDGDVLILPGADVTTRYEADGAIILPETVEAGPTLTHVAFYHRAIQPTVPAILADLPNLLFASETIEQLRRTSKTTDALIAEFVKRTLETTPDRRGTSARVLLLSAPDDDETLTLDAPVNNTKQISNRPVAWTIKPRIVPYRALATSPATTDALDVAIEGVGTRP